LSFTNIIFYAVHERLSVVTQRNIISIAFSTPFFLHNTLDS